MDYYNPVPAFCIPKLGMTFVLVYRLQERNGSKLNAALTPIGSVMSGNQGENDPGRVTGLPLPTMVADRPLGSI